MGISPRYTEEQIARSRERLHSFIEANPHKHIDEEVFVLLQLGRPEEIGGEILFKAHLVVDGCAVCSAMWHAGHMRASGGIAASFQS